MSSDKLIPEIQSVSRNLQWKARSRLLIEMDFLGFGVVNSVLSHGNAVSYFWHSL